MLDLDDIDTATHRIQDVKNRLRGKTLLVFGAGGMLGRAVRRRAAQLGMSPRSAFFDATDLDYVIDELRTHKPDYVINCAGYNGGVAFQKPFDIFSLNTAVPIFILRAMVQTQSQAKILMPVASCGYDEPSNFYAANADPNNHLIESGYLEGSPNESVQPHGYAKRNTVLACRYAAQQFGIRAVTVCPPTLFGPGDRYDKTRSKFPAATVRRLVDAVDDGIASVTFWGTGTATREVMYVEDAARTMLYCLVAYEDSKIPLNIGHHDICKVKEFVEYAAGVVGYRGEILWDATRPEGQLKKVTSKKRFWNLLEREEGADLGQALLATVADYKMRKAAGEFTNE